MEDERQEELDCIAAIFPEILVDPNNPFSVSMEVPVHPTSPVKVLFPASSDGLIPTPPLSTHSGHEGKTGPVPTNAVESQNLSYLPSLQLLITLPEEYPEKKAPVFELATTPAWLSRKHLDELQAKGEEMWEEAGRSSVVYGYIDFLQQEAENAFGFAAGRNLEVPQDFKISLLDHDIKATQAAFEKETFDCGVCLDPKKGTVCHRMIDCGHVFCVQCLQDFYNNAITEGNLAAVQCLTPGCAKKRGDEQVAKGRKAKTQLSPSELIQIPLEQDVVSRYVKLKHKAELESDKNTVYCPRKWCQGAARSKKHRKPIGFEETESDNEEEDEGTSKGYVAGADRLCICEDCSFAFCSRCYQGWHGELTTCMPRKDNGELTEEDKASLEYMNLHSTPCPTCSARAQKTHGCNHMICFKCHSHFCYLCSAWLPPANPYNHYNNRSSSCYYRLWELEEGDGDDFEHGGGRPVELHEDEEEELEIEPEPVVEVQIPEIVEPDEPREVLEPLQREGPLVLRINHVPAPPPPPAPEVPVRAAPNRGARRERVPGNPPNQRRVARQRNVVAGARRLGEAEEREAAEERRAEQAQQAWVQMFVQMAMNDEEDQLESDDEEDPAAWEIPVR
ncbi:translation termination inhibitor protein itt1 [Cadophora gregata]|uniref:translation termination inhibitor protein itt1 n=1 Tax=Cadophora gregata TaxID=51156 RepID=UPI0026DAFD75|nr:translation termination inhibitor protein itt1 [Cadophora gregata]KAK0101236.1 translation termination inhibitor protein itt1 [Cadophora gregata]KAK0106751.1 translation termination inhibitor protein itt1 [Cadophora gregata f. sp. sojae]